MSRLPVFSSALFFGAALLLQPASSALYAEMAKHPSIAWTENYEEGVARAKKEHKPIFLFFTGSDWCPWCMRFEKEILKTAEFTHLLGRELIFIKADFPQNISQNATIEEQNEALKVHYGIKGFPTVILLDQNSNEIARMGYEKIGGKAYAEKVQKKLQDYFANKAKKS